MCTTAMGRQNIEKVATFVQSEYGAQLIYGDTDSIYVHFPLITNAKALREHACKIDRDFLATQDLHWIRAIEDVFRHLFGERQVVMRYSNQSRLNSTEYLSMIRSGTLAEWFPILVIMQTHFRVII